MVDRSERRDEQYEAEITDTDEIDVLDFPPERSLGVHDLLDDDVPAAGDYAPDDLHRRQRRIRPERSVNDDGAVVIVAPDGTPEFEGERGTVDWDVVDLGGVSSDSAVAGHGRVESWPAEEAALHIEEPGDDDDTGGMDEGRTGVRGPGRGRLR